MGFWPPSAMYFQNRRNFLRNCLEIVWIFWGIFWEFFKRNFLEEFHGAVFWEKFVGRVFWGGLFLGVIFWEEYFRRNSLGGLCLNC